MERQVKLYLKKYKQDILPIFLIFAGIILFFRIIIPQVGDLAGMISQIQTQVETNSGLTDSQRNLSSINDAQLDDDYILVLKALPSVKSIGSIFEALTIAAGKSNVSIGSLNLQVGSVYEQEETPAGKSVGGVPFLNLLVRVNANSAAQSTRFAQVLYETVPILEINSISATSSDGKYDVNFFFKPISEKSFQAQTIVTPLLPVHLELLTTLRSWAE